MSVYLFWGAVSFCLYAYLGYPILLGLMGLVRHRTYPQNLAYAPRISVIIAAYNEAGVIKDKLDNVLLQGYPPEKLEIIVASDGSDDGTNEIVAAYAQTSPQVKLLALPRRGKAFALNSAAASAQGDILVFSDANAMLDPDALAYLVCGFEDAEVGGVAGNQRYTRSDKTGGASLGETLYWRYDRWLKALETQVGNAISADGALYAIRRELYVPITDPAATDDFAISTRVVTQGRRLIYQPNAVVSEATAGSSSREFRRKARIINRGLRSLFGLGQFLYPWHGGFYAVQLISHKLMRRLVPLALPVVFLANIVLWPRHLLYRLILVAQLLVYGLGLVGFALRNTGRGKIRLVYIPYYFCQANVAALLGLYWFLRGQRIALWQPQREDA